MLKYAKIIDDTTKACDVGLGTNTAFYRSIGMTEMNVEQAYDGKWYVSGYTPETPQSVINAERIAELEEKLEDTDAIVLELIENALMNGGNLVQPLDLETDYTEILNNRATWRAELSQLKN